MEQLTAKEENVYKYIVDVLSREGYSPSVRDICIALDISSTSTCHAIIEGLRRKGYLKRITNVSRTLLPNFPMNSYKVPIMGKVTAGTPITAFENLDGYIDFTSNGVQYQYDNLFALRVTGTSMIEAGIFDGDIVVVEKTPVADNGQIIVALVDDSATVKTFYKENGKYRLQPENKTMDPIICDEVTVLGRVISSVRYY